jgi:hypothetical protein
MMVYIIVGSILLLGMVAFDKYLDEKDRNRK